MRNSIERDLSRKMMFIGGPRQVGKTWLGKAVIGDARAYLNCDAADTRRAARPVMSPRSTRSCRSFAWRSRSRAATFPIGISKWSPAVQTWLADFEAWGGGLLETGLNHYSPYQYDAMGVLLRALDLSSQALNDGSLLIDREALRAAVRSTSNYPGVTGYITFEADGDRAP